MTKDKKVQAMKNLSFKLVLLGLFIIVGLLLTRDLTGGDFRTKVIDRVQYGNGINLNVIYDRQVGAICYLVYNRESVNSSPSISCIN